MPTTPQDYADQFKAAADDEARTQVAMGAVQAMLRGEHKTDLLSQVNALFSEDLATRRHWGVAILAAERRVHSGRG